MLLSLKQNSLSLKCNRDLYEFSHRDKMKHT
uniref:Uncharacterized protein n=1 Tax=Rhizophora mucronata TaxID=61149 RepID=A0A2P2N6M8_RHIMU